MKLRLSAAAGGILILLAGCGGSDISVPTVTVRMEPLVRRVAAEGNLESAKATPLSVPIEAPGPMRIAWLAPDGARVHAGDVIATFDPTELDKALDTARGDLAKTREQMKKSGATGSAALADLAVDADLAKGDLEAADKFQKRDQEVFSRHEILESAADRELAKAREENARKARALRAEQSAAERALIEIDARKAEVSIGRSERGLAAIEMRAPHDGLFVAERDFRNDPVRPGDTVFAGQPIGELPELSTMRAEVYVLEADADGLEVGQPATVIVESRPGRAMAARVARVDTLAKPRFRGSPVQYFAVDLDLAETDPKIAKPGARVRAELVLERRAQALAIPRQALFERGGKSVVFRREKAQASGRFTAVPVVTSPAGPGRLVVESGLSAGDVIALIDPELGSAPEKTETKGAPTGLPGAAARPAGPPPPGGAG
ncbi:MAG TPA: efflux RND transporter periplasmic adaptor subunit [Thermoanaerobaculia bacterium]|nr:efflux RND transporter periplasmic adaptor subunit [Thermoanaerobaculia bacterium]